MKISDAQDPLRVAQIVPDIGADKRLDYLVPADCGIGSIVTVPLGARRVRGWVVGFAPPQVSELHLKSVLRSAPGQLTPEIVDLAEWTAARYCGTMRAMLRAASVCAPRRVPVVATPAPAPINDSNAPKITLQVRAPGNPRIELVVDAVSPTGSTLVLVPEHRDIERLVPQLRPRVDREVVAWDPQASAVAQARMWNAARSGNVVVVGSRSAVWAPLPDLAAAIMLDEHDESYQSESQPTWHARAVLVERIRRRNGALTLVSPVPSLAAVTCAGERIAQDDADDSSRGWSPIETFDPRDIPPRERPFPSDLVQSVHEALENTGVLIVRNEIGGILLTACHHCGELQRCPECGTAARFEAGSLTCPRGHELAQGCPACGGDTFRAVRRGASGIREVLATLFPRAQVREVTSSTEFMGTVGPGVLCVGTEAVLRRVAGAIGLVVFLDFDRDMLAPRFRANEQALVLLARAARLLRGARGRIFVETRISDHSVLRAARAADPMQMVREELPVRRMLQLPPFGALAEVKGLPIDDPELMSTLGAELAGSGAALQGPDRHGRMLLRSETNTGLNAGAKILQNSVASVRLSVDPPRV